jgi:hypothetical protein
MQAWLLHAHLSSVRGIGRDDLSSLLIAENVSPARPARWVRQTINELAPSAMTPDELSPPEAQQRYCTCRRCASSR